MAWSEETFKKLVESIHAMFELQVKQRELYENLLEALTVKNYKENNPEAKSVVLASYFPITKEENGKILERDKYRIYIALDRHDPEMQKILRAREAYWGKAERNYKGLIIKDYDLTKFCPDKGIIAEAKSL